METKTLYVRGVPKALALKAKSMAAMQDKSLQDFLIEALEAYVNNSVVNEVSSEQALQSLTLNQ